MRISDWSSDVCSSDLRQRIIAGRQVEQQRFVDIIFGRIRTVEAAAGHFGAARPGQRPEQIAVAGQAVEDQPCRRREGEGQPLGLAGIDMAADRSEEHTSELQSLMRISYAVFCLKKKKKRKTI